MQHFSVNVEARPVRINKGARKQYRRRGFILSSLYGKGVEPVSLAIEARSLAKAFASGSGVNTLLDVNVSGAKHVVKVINMEYDPITGGILHVGLHKILTNEPQKAMVPVEVTGESEAVRTNAGLLEITHPEVEVRGLPENLPNTLPIDITGMEVGDVKRAGDIALPSGYELLTDPQVDVLAVKPNVDLTVGLAEAEDANAEGTSEVKDVPTTEQD